MRRYGTFMILDGGHLRMCDLVVVIVIVVVLLSSRTEVYDDVDDVVAVGARGS